MCGEEEGGGWVGGRRGERRGTIHDRAQCIEFRGVVSLWTDPTAVLRTPNTTESHGHLPSTGALNPG